MITSRWLQEWDMLPLDSPDGIFIKGQFTRNESDDISIVNIDIIPI
jgi:hypothetical protein